jgi:hypothetical protein
MTPHQPEYPAASWLLHLPGDVTMPKFVMVPTRLDARQGFTLAIGANLC